MDEKSVKHKKPKYSKGVASATTSAHPLNRKGSKPLEEDIDEKNSTFGVAESTNQPKKKKKQLRSATEHDPNEAVKDVLRCILDEENKKG